MKLPANSNDRLKIILMVSLGLLGALYGIYAGVLNPLRARRDATALAVDILRDNLRKAESSAARVDRNLRENAELSAALGEVSARYLLQPRLGNYLLSARERLEHYAQAVGVRIVNLDEVGLVTLPSAGNGAQQRRVKAYVSRAVLEGSYEELLRLLQGLELENPYACAGGLQIAVQPQQPARHIITLEIQWPVWADPAMAELLIAQAKAAQGNRAAGTEDGSHADEL